MNARAYYNENNKKAVAALRQLIAEGAIAPGVVDDRSIKEVQAHELHDFTQWHFFAGAGLWSVGARAAGWPDHRPILSASCPCQPFSAAGKGLGTDDPRHLWPDLYRIVSAARDAGFCPAILVGEQVAGKTGYGWFDGVRADLARKNIAARTVDFPVCTLDAPHERNRLWWLAVADAESEFGGRDEPQRRPRGRAADRRPDASSDVAHGDKPFVQGQPQARQLRVDEQDGRLDQRHADGPHGAVGDSEILGSRAGLRQDRAQRYWPIATNPNGRNGSWYVDWEWIACHDGQARRAKPGVPMLVNGMVGRGDLWSLAGNSISPLAATEVIGAYLDAEAEQHLRLALTSGVFA